MSSFAQKVGTFDLAQDAKVLIRGRLDDGDIFHAVPDQSSKFLGRGLSASGPIHCSGTTLDIPVTNTRRMQLVPYQYPKSLIELFTHPAAILVLTSERQRPRYTSLNLSAFTYLNVSGRFG